MACVTTAKLESFDDKIIEMYRKSAKEYKLSVITKTESSIYSLFLIPYRKYNGNAILINSKYLIIIQKNFL
nr:hypothetical protein GTC16762_04800 [Pigmentibacter ruber]